MSKREVILEIGQWVSVVVIIGAVGFEFAIRAHWINCFITLGACTWGITQKLKHPKHRMYKAPKPR